MTAESIPQKRALKPSVLVVFGVTGNLARNKLLPALYQLLRFNHLPEEFVIIGVYRDASFSLDSLIEQVRGVLAADGTVVDEVALQKLKRVFRPIQMESTLHSDFLKLRTLLDEIDQTTGKRHNRLFYMAIPPDIFKSVVQCLADAGMNTHDSESTSRILVEKPFGSDLATARDLINYMGQCFHEDQIYRIDHYLAKETAQNILAFRFNNPLIEDIWGRQFIDHIQITAAESIGIEGRTSFYEGMGAARDIIQSHLLQLMALVMMEAPTLMDSVGIHAEKLALLNSIEPIKTNHVDEVAVRGQYKGYHDEVKNPKSVTETFAAIKLEVTNSRWGGVPILLRTGKALKNRMTEINVVFNDRSRRNVPANLLKIRIQPNEGISLRLTAKKPGFSVDLQPVDMDFSYQSAFEGDNPDAYERVLVDAIAGDQSLFATSQEVLRCWEIIDPLLQVWKYQPAQPDVYEPGSWGPHSSDELARSFGSEWLA